MPYYGGTPMATDPKFLMDRLMKNGMSRAQAAAVVGNLQRESGLASNNMNKDEGAYGLMQWRGSRFEQLQQFAAAKGVPWTDPGTQADFIAHEMATTERKSSQGFMAAKTVDEASAALKPVIRYGDKSGPERAMHARNFFGQQADARNAFGANDPVAGASVAPPSQAPQPTAAQPAVSRETAARAYAAPIGQAAPARGRGLRAGIDSLGDLGAAYLNRRPDRQIPGLAALGSALSGAGQQMAAPPPSNLPAAVPDADPAYLGGRDSLAVQVTGPPGAPDPPRFPGGVPMPRARPMTGPGLPAGAPIDPLQTVAGLGSLVDPMDYRYG